MLVVLLAKESSPAAAADAAAVRLGCWRRGLAKVAVVLLLSCVDGRLVSGLDVASSSLSLGGSSHVGAVKASLLVDDDDASWFDQLAVAAASSRSRETSARQ
jgi:hypothetical protein